jgi:hypothetical protein
MADQPTPEQLREYAIERLTDEGGAVMIRESDAKRRIEALGDMAPEEIDAGGDAAKELVQ